MALLPGVYQAKKKDGTIYFRSSVTFRTKHISLGSFPTEELAHKTYVEARRLLESKTPLAPDDYHTKDFPYLPFAKWISLINFKNNGFYIKTPIYLRKNFFYYYLSPTDVLTFDTDDLFYYSNHSIMRRGNHLFVAEYGMQTNIHSRYGIKNFARLNVDYRFVNGDTNDFRYSNIEILNPYHGVTLVENQTSPLYAAKIHIHGDYLIGRYQTATEAAIAYNKAVDTLESKHFKKNFEKNYIEELTAEEYKTIYQQIKISPKITNYVADI
ncbi:MAG: hypothetical protein SO170_05815 [Butyribacter sp.]|nr:hypothetical protein [Butyribacter sp.]